MEDNVSSTKLVVYSFSEDLQPQDRTTLNALRISFLRENALPALSPNVHDSKARNAFKLVVDLCMYVLSLLARTMTILEHCRVSSSLICLRPSLLKNGQTRCKLS